MTELEKAKTFWRKAVEQMDGADTEDLKICRRVLGGQKELEEEGPITIVIVGDSVSHGCFVPPKNHDYRAVYHDRLRLMINERFPYTPVNIINAAVGGVTAPYGLSIMDKYVLPHNPDLVIVCFGLNDVNEPIPVFTDAMRGIFNKCKAAGVDVMYLTSNMLNTYRTEDTEPKYYEYAAKTADMQNSGMLDALTDAGRALAKECGVPVADAYAVWRGMADAGIDTSSLLINRINHPEREMHALFAEVLYKRIFGEAPILGEDADAGMYRA
ncbi:MAG: GDSL-type esterase/lipase family protein [Clostridia bacterium]|nr:GDSL-type esterase/lipase family protein [Clostridia bacterium]